MKFLFLIAFLVFSPQLAWADGCPLGEKMAKVVSVVEQYPDQYRVNSKGAYVSSLFWNLQDVQTKENMARAFAIYRHCHLFQMSTWAPSIEIFDNYSGKKVGKLSAWSGYTGY